MDDDIKKLKTLLEQCAANIQVLSNVIRDPDGGSELAKFMILATADNMVEETNKALQTLAEEY